MERLIHERIDMLVMRLKKGLDVSEDERRIPEMRSILETLRATRKTMMPATLVVHPTNGPTRTEPIAKESQT